MSLRNVSLELSFTPQDAFFLAACVAEGRARSRSAVVREAIRLLRERTAAAEAGG
ncbi:type II toxin-antitoxin system ParD family antitoxin [Spongiactinospora sp. TRM90649]|uniref:ribbon-helix-helix domain-containing protein n=1 Tax=Spongiactinospora sp. TRM90649 TaxID=3031114 RepID=UPI0023F7DAF3|nr:type II toxin-antitoxin system ParD family antitoxin [Spongiactinospora sp. TRM90649]MDF5752624.1 type II toxin-antitoxin system ParD family antitoxin [Spongiactinospora sp. TRM90649]